MAISTVLKRSEDFGQSLSSLTQESDMISCFVFFFQSETVQFCGMCVCFISAMAFQLGT